MRILLIQLRRVGDVLLTAPLASHLRQAFPDAHIDFLVEPPGDSVLLNHPDLHEVIRYDPRRPLAMIQDIRRRRYDWVFDSLNNPRTAILTVLSGAPNTVGFPFFGWGSLYRHSIRRPPSSEYIVFQKQALLAPLLETPRDPALKPSLTLSEEERRASDRLWDSLKLPGGKRAFAVIPTHRRPIRRWRPEGFAAVADRVSREFGLTPVLFWGPGEEEGVEAVRSRMKAANVLIPPVSLREAAGLLKRCAFALTNDNGPMHLAVSVGTPTVTIYGPTDPGCWNPGGSRHLVIRREGLHCLGCNFRSECPFGHECMTELSEDAVFQRCRELIGSIHEKGD